MNLLPHHRDPSWTRSMRSVDDLQERCVCLPIAGCWIWMGGIDAKGYGRLSLLNYPVRSVHRLAILLSGRDLPPRTCALHRCDTPSCVNPDHLFVGSNLDNIRDKTAKGRSRGGRHYQNGTVCKHGHPYTEGSFRWVVTRTGTIARRCRKCTTNDNGRHRVRRHGAGLHEFIDRQTGEIVAVYSTTLESAWRSLGRSKYRATLATATDVENALAKGGRILDATQPWQLDLAFFAARAIQAGQQVLDATGAQAELPTED